MNAQEVIYEYEQSLIGKKKSIDSEIFCFNEYGNEKLVLEIFRYAFEKIMHWSPAEAYHRVDRKTMDLLKLRHLVKYIRFPGEFDPATDYFFIISKLYPDKIKIDSKERTLILYQQLLSGKMKKFPKRFLEGREGEMRALFCLKYAIQNFGTFESIEDLYRAFSTSEGSAFLKKVKLYQACTTLFDFPIDFLHNSFPISERLGNEFIYSMYKFRVYEAAKKREESMRKRKETAPKTEE